MQIDADTLTARQPSSEPAPTYPARNGGPARFQWTHLLPWAGVLVTSGLAATLGWVGYSDLVSAGDLRGALAVARGVSVGPAVIVVVVLLFVAEQKWPAVSRPAFARAHLVDAAYFGIFAILVLPMLTLVQTGFALEIERHASFLILGHLSAAPQVAVVGVILVAMDAMNWLAHLANHRFETLWRLHALHHSQEDMSVFTTFRTHPLVHASYLPSVLPALVLGASGTVPVVALVIYGCLVTAPHANVRWTYGALGGVVVSPAYHRIHHARELSDPYGAVNLGFVLVTWDRWARRAVFPTGEVIPTGIAGRPVPVEQAVSPTRAIRAQLAQPFRFRAFAGRDDELVEHLA